MTHDEAFLQAIQEDPGDESLRLIYADYLDERGDPRGEFIRAQCQLANTAEGDPRREELQGRERQLLTAHEQEWIGPLKGLATRWCFRRGFVEDVWTTARAFCTHAHTLFRSVPHAHFHLRRATSRVADLVAFPFLSRLSGLDLRETGYSHDRSFRRSPTRRRTPNGSKLTGFPEGRFRPLSQTSGAVTQELRAQATGYRGVLLLPFSQGCGHCANGLSSGQG
jgi:uncharacterized protein (TIGR02996 family)